MIIVNTKEIAIMFTIPNLISFIRLPLAFLFLQNNILFRLFIIILAMISDALDGYLARKYRLSSTFGTFLDPITDKFFVLFILGILIMEEKMMLWEAATFLTRDFSLLLYGIYLTLTRRITTYHFRAIWFGKLFTFLQFSILLALTFGFVIPSSIFTLFGILGLLALIELGWRKDSY